MKKILQMYGAEFVYILCEFLLIENILTPLFQVFLLTYNHLQPLTFLFQNMTIQSNHGQITMAMIIKPFYYIKEDILLNAFKWCIFMLQQIILGITLKQIYTRIKVKKSNQISRRNKFLDHICCIYFYMISTTFYPGIVEIFLYNLTYKDIDILIISIIQCAELFGIILFSDQIFTKGLVLKSNSLLYLNRNSKIYLIKILRISQILIFLYLENWELNLIIQSILYLSQQLIQLLILFESRIYISNMLVLGKILLSTIGIIISVIILITKEEDQSTLWIVLALIPIQILYNEYNKPILQIANNNLNILKFQFAWIQQIDDSQPKNQLILKQMLVLHQNNCSNGECQCRDSEINYHQILIKIIDSIFSHIAKNKNIKNPQILFDQISILIRTNQYVKAFKLIQQKRTLSELDEFHLADELFLQFLKNVIYGLMIIQMRDRKIYTSLTGQQISVNLKQFSQNEKHQVQTQSKFKYLVKLKLSLFSCLIDKQKNLNINANEIYEIITQLTLFKNELIEQFTIYPTQSNQNILKFYCVEILNDFIEAFNLHQSNAFDDEKYLLFSNSQYNRIFGLNPTYIVVATEKDMNLVITRISKTANNFFYCLSYGQQRITEKISLDQFFPTYIKNKHNQLVQQFLDFGVNKYYQSQQQSYVQKKQFDIQNNNLTMIPVEMMQGLNHCNLESLEFFCFFYVSDDHRMIIVIDTEMQVINVSESLIDLILISSTKIDVRTIIPYFEQIIHQEYVDNVTVILKRDQSSSQVSEYSATLNIKKKQSNNDSCYFVILDNLKRNFNKMQSFNDLTALYTLNSNVNSLLKTQKIPLDCDESIKKQIPYYDDMQMQQYQIQQRIPNFSIAQIESQFQSQQEGQESSNILQVKRLKQEHFNKDDSMVPPQNVFSPKDSLNQKLLFSHNHDKDKETRYYGKNKRNIDLQNMDLSSQVSSLTAIKKSKFYKRFETIHILTHSKSQNAKVLQMNNFLIMSITLAIIYASILFAQMSNIADIIKDIKLLSIRCDVTEPIDSFLITRYTVVGYNSLYRKKVITNEQQQSLVIFPNSNMALAYDHLKYHLYSVLEKPEIDSITKDRVIQVHMYQKLNVGIIEYISFRTLASLLMNYQYEYKLALTGKGTQLDSAYFYFSFKNYLVVKQTFTTLNEEILDLALRRVELESEKWLLLFIPFTAIFCLFNICICINHIKFNSEQQLLMNFILKLDIVLLDQERYRISCLFNQINQDFDQIKVFELDTDLIDQDIEKLKIKDLKLQSKKNSIFFVKNPSSIYGILIQIVNLFVFLAFSIGVFMVMSIYFTKYQETAIFYNKLSNLNSDVPTAFSQREVLYRRYPQYPFYTIEDMDGLIELFQNTLIAIDNYTREYINLNKNLYLFDDHAIELFKNVYQNDLCQQLSEEMEEKSKSICNIVMEGKLKFGLHQILLDITNNLRIEQVESQNFTILNTPMLELEGVTIITDVLSNLKEIMYQHLIETTNQLIYQHYVISIFYIIFEVAIIYLYYKYVNTWKYHRYQCLKQIVYLLPRNTLMFDDMFHRLIRSYIQQENI